MVEITLRYLSTSRMQRVQEHVPLTQWCGGDGVSNYYGMLCGDAVGISHVTQPHTHRKNKVRSHQKEFHIRLMAAFFAVNFSHTRS